jgi:hypothetical protein
VVGAEGSTDVWKLTISSILLLLIGSLSASLAAAPEPRLVATLSLVSGAEGRAEIQLDGSTLGRLEPTDRGWLLRADGASASIESSIEPLDPARSYPRRETTTGRLGSAGPAFRQTFTRLAPAAPLSVEGLGLVIASDEPGLMRDEHAELRRWLASQGLAADTLAFEAIHEADAGRPLVVWYEISGRRKNGLLENLNSGEELARFDSLYRSENGQLKIHHQRTGENGRFTYHRRSLELADTIETSAGEEEPLQSHHCGCYGYAIAADFMTLGDLLYQVEADWLDDRVGMGFFVGLETRDEFPWLGLGDRRRIRDLARRARAFLVRDADGEMFAEIILDLPSDPPSPLLGPITYRINVRTRSGQLERLAVIEHTPSALQLDLYGEGDWEILLERLDRLFAAMPTQIERGDGVRDSHLGEIEQFIDQVRLLRQPGADRLADLVSDVDAQSAPGKIRALFAGEIERFAVEASALPPAPRRGPAQLAENPQPKSTLGGARLSP